MIFHDANLNLIIPRVFSMNIKMILMILNEDWFRESSI